MLEQLEQYDLDDHDSQEISKIIHLLKKIVKNFAHLVPSSLKYAFSNEGDYDVVGINLADLARICVGLQEEVADLQNNNKQCKQAITDINKELSSLSSRIDHLVGEKYQIELIIKALNKKKMQTTKDLNSIYIEEEPSYFDRLLSDNSSFMGSILRFFSFQESIDASVQKCQNYDSSVDKKSAKQKELTDIDKDLDKAYNDSESYKEAKIKLEHQEEELECRMNKHQKNIKINNKQIAKLESYASDLLDETNELIGGINTITDKEIVNNFFEEQLKPIDDETDDHLIFPM